MKILARSPSTLGGYDIAVVQMKHEDLDTIAMVEVTGEKDVPGHAFSNSLAGEDMHNKPNATTYALAMLTMRALDESTPVDPLRPQRVLIAGLGAGCVHTLLQRTERNLEITSVEPDDTVIQFARLYWGFDGEVKRHKIEYYLAVYDDAPFDVIVFNHYSYHHEVSPLIQGTDVYEIALQHLQHNGCLIFNCFDYVGVPDVTKLKDFARKNGLAYQVVDMEPNREGPRNLYVAMVPEPNPKL